MYGRFQSLPPLPRRVILGVWGATFIIVIFGLIPGWATDLNHELGWPRWETTGGQVAGAALFVASLGLVLYCSRLFSSVGKGTPVPIAPPKELRVGGGARSSHAFRRSLRRIHPRGSSLGRHSCAT